MSASDVGENLSERHTLLIKNSNFNVGERQNTSEKAVKRQIFCVFYQFLP